MNWLWFILINAALLGSFCEVVAFIIKLIKGDGGNPEKEIFLVKSKNLTWKSFLTGLLIMIIGCVLSVHYYDIVLGGIAYLNEGVDYAEKGDLENAAKSWEAAVQKGNHKAEYNLGLYYMDVGLDGNALDVDKGYELVRKAAAGGVYKAKNLLEHVEKVMNDNDGVILTGVRGYDWENDDSQPRKTVIIETQEVLYQKAQ